MGSLIIFHFDCPSVLLWMTKSALVHANTNHYHIITSYGSDETASESKTNSVFLLLFLSFFHPMYMVVFQWLKVWRVFFFLKFSSLKYNVCLRRILRSYDLSRTLRWFNLFFWGTFIGIRAQLSTVSWTTTRSDDAYRPHGHSLHHLMFSLKSWCSSLEMSLRSANIFALDYGVKSANFRELACLAVTT